MLIQITIAVALVCASWLAILEARTMMRLRRFARTKEVLRNAIGHRLDLDASATRMLEWALIEVKYEELHYKIEVGLTQ